MRGAAILLALCCTCQALDLTMESGMVYTNIRLREKAPMGIRIQHDTGLSFLDYLTLSAPDRLTFGYEEATYNAALAKLGQTAGVALTSARPAPVPASTTSRGFAPKFVAPAATPSPAQTTSSISSGRCSATTKKGYQCSRAAQAGRSYCYQHPR